MKKVLEIREVAKKLPSNLWKTLSLVKLLNFQRKKDIVWCKKGTISLKECKSVASNTGKIIDIDQKKWKMLEYFFEVHRA